MYNNEDFGSAAASKLVRAAQAAGIPQCWSNKSQTTAEVALSVQHMRAAVVVCRALPLCWSDLSQTTAAMTYSVQHMPVMITEPKQAMLFDSEAHDSSS